MSGSPLKPGLPGESPGIAGIPISRLLWMFAWLIVASVIAFAYGFYRQFESISRQSVERELSNLAGILAADLRAELDGARASVRATAVALAELGASKDTGRITARLRAGTFNAVQIRELIWVDAGGRIYTDAPAQVAREMIGQDIVAAFANKDGKSGSAIGAPVAERNGPSPLLPVSHTVRDAKGQVQGVPVALVASEAQQGALRSLSLGSGGRVSLFHDGGSLVASYPPLPAFPKESFAETPAFKRLATLPGGTVRDETILASDDAFVAVRRISNAPLFLLVSRPADEALEALALQRRYILSVALALIIAVVVFSGLFARQLRQREVTEAALGLSRQALLDAQRVGRLGSWSYDVQSGQIDASDEAQRILEFAPNGAFASVATVLERLIHPDEREAVRQNLDSVLAGTILDSEHRIITPNGKLKWVRARTEASLVDGKPVSVRGTLQEITEAKQGQLRLMESEERFRRIIEFTSDWYWETDADYRFTKLTVGSTRRPDLIPALIGKRRWEIEHSGASPEVWEAHRATIAAREPFKDLILEFLEPESGRIIDYSSISGEPFYDEQGVFQGYRGTGRYITQQKRYELDLAERTHQLAQVNAQLKREAGRRRELERRMLAAIEKELTQVGFELHDELGQNLTGIALLAKTLQKRLAERGSPEAGDAARVHALVNETIRQTRLISHGLSPHILGPEGLIEALRQLADDVDSLGLIECRFEYDGEPSITDNLIARGLYRIAQEAVNNALKHSRAKLVVIELFTTEEETRLSILDNGIGIGSDDEPLSDAALHSIKYRVGVIGGRLNVHHRPGGGTIVEVSLTSDSATATTSAMESE